MGLFSGFTGEHDHTMKIENFEKFFMVCFTYLTFGGRLIIPVRKKITQTSRNCKEHSICTFKRILKKIGRFRSSLVSNMKHNVKLKSKAVSNRKFLDTFDAVRITREQCGFT